MAGALFGTDGIRGRPGVFPLDESSLIRLGEIIGDMYAGGRILIGRDTRASGTELEAMLGRGIGSRADIYNAGIVPTPAISFLLTRHAFACGIVISASHNPGDENGVKFFNRRGEKISRRQEKEIEGLFGSGVGVRRRPSRLRVRPFAGGEEYLRHLSRIGADLRGQLPHLVLDGANGSASASAPALFEALDTPFTAIHCRPDGGNINRDCGSTSPASLRSTVLQSKATLGLALDGDADRVVFVDGEGNLLEGDHTLFLLARLFRKCDPAFPGTVVGTVMSNLGLEETLASMGLDFVRTAVGDRSVYLELKRQKALLGGEPCGHTILRQYQPCGDGLLTAIHVLKAQKKLGLDPGQVFRQLPLYPQRVLSLPVARKKELRRWRGLQRLAEDFTRNHGAHARLLIRYSGTEPKIRVMLEARDSDLIDTYMDRFATLIRSEIGG